MLELRVANFKGSSRGLGFRTWGLGLGTLVWDLGFKP